MEGVESMVTRRRLLQQGAAGMGSAALAGCAATQVPVPDSRSSSNQYVDAPPLPRAFRPPPALDLSGQGQVPIRYAGEARLFYWDTGGTGPVILLAHAGTGSAYVWGYQQQAFAAAGYRVVAYSRRGYRGSDAGPIDEAGNALPASGRPLDDIEALVRHLDIERFHLLGHAAGGGIANGYIKEYPQRIISSISVAALQSISEQDWSGPMNSIRETGGAGVVGSFNSNPAHIRELGPSYRWANPAGVAAWVELEHSNRPVTVNHAEGVTVTWSDIASRTFPTLLVGGDADLYVPPSMYRYLQTRTPQSELVIVPEAGHSVNWEQPDVFNNVVLDFLARRR
jgi:non-heme chloroperoxidase